MSDYAWWKSGGSRFDDRDPEDDIRYHPTWCGCEECQADRQAHYEDRKQKETGWQKVHRETKDLFE